MSFSSVAPPREAKELLSMMRQGCREARVRSKIEVDDGKIDEFLLDILPTAPSKAELDSWLASGFRLPLAYPSLHAEINVLAHLCFLNSLSGYRVAFHRALGQGAHKTIVQIVLSLYLDDPAGDSTRPLSAQTLSVLTPIVLLDRLGLPTHEERAHPTVPAAIIGVRRRDEVFEALETLCIAANDTGRRLQEMSCPDLGTFVQRAVQQAAKEGTTDEERASLIATQLIAAFPAFNDAYILTDADGERYPVHVHKRALLLISWLHSSFLTRGDPTMVDKLPLPSPSVLPAFVDNVIPSMLVHFGILNMQDAPNEGLRRWAAAANEFRQREKNAVPRSASDEEENHPVEAGPTLTQEEAYRIRAASVDACYAIAQRAHALAQPNNRPWLASVTEALIDGFLWTQAKRPEWTVVPRMVEKKTFMY